MLSVYPACFFKEENSYSVIFPALDLDTCGETKDEAMAVDCLAGRLQWLKQDGDPIPAPSSINTVGPVAVSRELEIEPSETFVNMVAVDVKEHFDKSVSKTLTIRVWLNTAAVEININFSQVLQEALLAKVQA